MSFDWNAHFAALPGSVAATVEGGVITHFGNLDSELDAARAGTVVAPLDHLGLIAVSGDDAANFLHNQLTSDVNHLAPGSAQHSAWCSAKGRMLASFLVLNVDATFYLRLDVELLPAVLKRLQMFVLRSKVKLADVSADTALIGLAGPQAEATLRAAGLALPAGPLAITGSAGAIVVRLGPQRFELTVARAQLAAIWPQLTSVATTVGVAAWRWLDIEAGLPLVTAATREEFVPQMANFEQLGGVSFHKGCYPGQEVVARTQYLGKVKRHLYRVTAAEAMQPGTPMYSAAVPDQICGHVVNAAPAPGGGNVALAVLMESAADGRVHLRSPDGPPLTAATPVASNSPVAN